MKHATITVVTAEGKKAVASLSLSHIILQIEGVTYDDKASFAKALELLKRELQRQGSQVWIASEDYDKP